MKNLTLQSQLQQGQMDIKTIWENFPVYTNAHGIISCTVQKARLAHLCYCYHFGMNCWLNRYHLYDFSGLHLIKENQTVNRNQEVWKCHLLFSLWVIKWIFCIFRKMWEFFLKKNNFIEQKCIFWPSTGFDLANMQVSFLACKGPSILCLFWWFFKYITKIFCWLIVGNQELCIAKITVFYLIQCSWAKLDTISDIFFNFTNFHPGSQ